MIHHSKFFKIIYYYHHKRMVREIAYFPLFLKSAIIGFKTLLCIITKMTRRKIAASETTLLPQGVIIQFRRRLRQATGLMIGLLALAFATTLFSYSPHDPDVYKRQELRLESWLLCLLKEGMIKQQ